MSRFILAFACFFRLLFTGRLPDRAVEYLPEEALPPQLGAGEPEDEPKRETTGAKAAAGKDNGAKAAAGKDKGAKAAAGKDNGAKGGAAKPEAAAGDKTGDRKAQAAEPDRAAEARARRTASLAEHHRDGALALLALLQREGRLVDFLREDLDSYDDADIGGAVRDIHRGCKKVLEEHLRLEAVMPGEEDDAVTIPKGFDPGEVRLIGEVRGEPPFKGVLRHHGWRVADAKLPTLTEGVDRRVLAPAEVELA